MAMTLLRELRLEKTKRENVFIRVEDVARGAGVSVPTLKNLESGRTKGRLDTLDKLAVYYGVDRALLEEAHLDTGAAERGRKGGRPSHTPKVSHTADAPAP